jgi:hypothetical protein
VDDRTLLTLVRLHDFQLEQLKLLKEIVNRGGVCTWPLEGQIEDLAKRVQADRELILNPKEGE